MTYAKYRELRSKRKGTWVPPQPPPPPAPVVYPAVLLADTGSEAGSDLQTKAAALADLFESQQTQAKPVLIGQFPEFDLGRMHRTEQAIQLAVSPQGKIHVRYEFGCDATRFFRKPDGAELAQAAQTDVEKRVLLLDQARLQQQGANFTGSLDVIHAA